MIVINGKNAESKISMRVITKYMHKIGVPAKDTFEFLRSRMTFEDAIQLFILGLSDKSITLEVIDKELNENDALVAQVYNDVILQLFPPAPENDDTNTEVPNVETQME